MTKARSKAYITLIVVTGQFIFTPLTRETLVLLGYAVIRKTYLLLLHLFFMSLDTRFKLQSVFNMRQSLLLLHQIVKSCALYNVYVEYIEGDSHPHSLPIIALTLSLTIPCSLALLHPVAQGLQAHWPSGAM